MFIKQFLFLFFSLTSFNIFSQQKKIKVISIDSLKYYYSYQAYDFKIKDTITLISSKKDKEFKLIKFNINKVYEVKTRLRSALKVSKKLHMQVKPGMNFLNSVKISNNDNLPILILDYEEIEEN